MEGNSMSNHVSDHLETINQVCEMIDDILLSICQQGEINTGRQIELDIAKGFAIIFMVWVHTAETSGN